MNIEILTALCTFAFVASVTPGPNNLMLMASGANFGIRRTLPHLCGIVAGFTVMVMLVGVGLMQIFAAYPVVYEVLRFFSIVYLGYLAWKIAASDSISASASTKPMTILQAALFQWVNPKAWAFALTLVAVYAPTRSLAAVGFVALVASLVNLPSIFVWIVIGNRMQRYLREGIRLRIFNYLMALLLLASLYPVVFGRLN
ncbi:MAG: LysE family translocator [Gammaproteobacteria bacterium]|jgi:threonine/homoserine/homoserine lactone efflux protein